MKSQYLQFDTLHHVVFNEAMGAFRVWAAQTDISAVQRITMILTSIAAEKIIPTKWTPEFTLLPC
jgi:RecB family exonuclease